MRAASTVCAVLLLTSCGQAGLETRTLDVYAASSLTEAFRDLEGAFEARHPGIDVTMTFAGSQVLRLQIEQGADADIFASADVTHMQALVEAGRIRESRIFAHNELAVIVPLANPAGIEAFRDLPNARRLVIGTPAVPVGRYARETLKRAASRFGPEFETKVLESVVSEENNVRLVRAKVELGEADAAIVYRTDAIASDRVRLVPVPAELNARADYVVGAIEDAPNPDAAQGWITFLDSPYARQLLVGQGFSAE